MLALLNFVVWFGVFLVLGVPWVTIFVHLLLIEFLFAMAWICTIGAIFKVNPPITVGSLSGIIGPFPRWPIKPYDIVEPIHGAGSAKSFGNHHVGHEEGGGGGGGE